jgi:hypothetical protein
MFAGSFLEGDAKAWFTNFFHDPANIPPFMLDWTLFTIELQRNFRFEDKIGTAEEDLHKLVMTNKDHVTYFTAWFRAIISTLNGLWDDRNLWNMYYQKIAPQLRSQFVSASVPVPATLEPLIATVEWFDRAYWADFELNWSVGHFASANESSREKRSLANQGATVAPAKPPSAPLTTSQPATLKPSATVPHLTKEGKLTDEERR